MKWKLTVTGAHKGSATGEDGGPKLPPAPMAPGSDGVAPRIEVWGPSGYTIPIGTGHAAILLEDVTIPFSTTKPLLMLGADSDAAFGGTVPLPLDLGPFGAPGFQLVLDPVLFLPGFEDPGMHYAILPFSVPNDPAVIGTYVYAQWVLNDPAANALGKTFSQGILLVVTP